jgi:bifunctional non-homologous end joining protein LigD
VTAGRTVEISHPDKVFFPDAGLTKADVVEYYRRIADLMAPRLRDRPLVMHRFPDGISGDDFLQKTIPDYFPDWVDRVGVERERGGSVTYVVCNDEGTLVYLADQAVLTPHLLLSAVAAPRNPVELILDLDPPVDDPDPVRAAARHVRAVLDELGLMSFVKATGSRGLHVHVPLDGSTGFDEVRPIARTLARAVVERDPDLLTVEQRKDKRGRRVFVDWLRNGYGQHAVAPYAVRAKPEAPVAVPLDWEEALSAGFHPRRYTIDNIFRRLARKHDPWTTWDQHRVSVQGSEGNGLAALA